MKAMQQAKAIADQLDTSERRKWPAVIEAAIRDVENEIIARLSEKFESHTGPLSPPSAAAIVRELYGFRSQRPDDRADRDETRSASVNHRKAAPAPRRT